MAALAKPAMAGTAAKSARSSMPCALPCPSSRLVACRCTSTPVCSSVVQGIHRSSRQAPQQLQQQQWQQHGQLRQALTSRSRPSVATCATDPDRQASSWNILPSRFNPAYAAILAAYAGLFALQNPYIFAVLAIATIIPQNSTTTSLNTLVILFYDSGLFMNFAEAVYCVRLITWLSILCTLASFAVFA